MAGNETNEERRIIEGLLADVYIRIGTEDEEFARACALNDLRLCNTEMSKIRRREEEAAASQRTIQGGSKP